METKMTSVLLSWQHGIDTPSPADFYSRRLRRRLLTGLRPVRMVCETSGLALFVWFAEPGVPR